MISIFSPQGRQRLDAAVQKGLLCVFDFDGTLAPIVPEADQAYLPAEVKQRLIRLMQLAPVAILTGRSLQDIRSRLDFEPNYVLGNHGIEGLPGWEKRALQHQEQCQAWVESLTEAMQAEGGFDPGIRIEDKRYSLSVHYRQTSDPQKAESQLAALFAKLMPEARVMDGKFVFNLLPPGAEHKGSAMEKLIKLAGARGTIYVGDDVTDEDVFCLRRPDLLSIRVEAVESSAAALFLPHPGDILLLLDELIRRLQQDGRQAIA